MLKQLNRKKKKKGFTLIELVIVLAVLAIIALIAIPNFTKVRNDSLAKADARTAEQIENITLMAIADKDITALSTTYYVRDGGAVFDVAINGTALDKTVIGDYSEMLKEVKAPQVNGMKSHGYKVVIDDKANVTVNQYGDSTAISERK